MKRFRLPALLLALLLTAPDPALAQDDSPVITPVRRTYLTGGFDGMIFSSSLLDRPGKSEKLSTLRFTLFFNADVLYHVDFSDHAGLFTGIGIKNIGYITKDPDPIGTTKRRTYNLGVPLGLKFGNMRSGSYFFLGGGIDLPFHYKMKQFTDRSDKNKNSEWFSDQVATLMPNVFAGVQLNPGISFKLQYYPQNFLNEDFEDEVNGVRFKPYAGTNVNLIYLSVGLNLNSGAKTRKTKPASGPLEM